MEEISSDRLNFLKLKLHNERDFVVGYYNITKEQVRYMFSDILKKPCKECHISKLNYEEICKCFEVLRALVLAARKGEGRRIPKTVTKPKKYGIQVREEQQNEQN